MGRRLTEEDDRRIQELYLEHKKSSTEIGRILGTSHRSVLNHLQKMGITRRNLAASHFAYHQKDRPPELTDYSTLYQWYIVEHRTKEQIGLMLNCAPHVIDRALRRMNIPVRGASEAKIGVQCGSQHHNWEGGITPLNLRVREYYQNNISPLIRQRDNFTCQQCGAHSNLHVHHIYSLACIIRDILSEHTDLDKQKDVNQLYTIITHDARFLDANNLVTLCADCHKAKHRSLQTISSQASIEEGSTTIAQASTSQAIGDGNGEYPSKG